MGICRDQSTTYLQRLGYNVVRHPQEGISPLHLIGRQRGTTHYLGSLHQLITNPSGPLPPTQTDLAAADVNGKRSSKLKLAIGADILGSIIGAMGGTLGVETSYTNARTVEFVFSDVLKDSAMPLDVGNYLRDGDIDAGNKILSQYVLGNGQLYVILETIKCRKITVNYEINDGVGAKVEVPVIQGVIGGNIEVKTDQNSASTVTYVGKTALTFGFRCFEVGVEDGDLTLMAAKPGAVPLAAGLDSHDAAIASQASLLSPVGAGLLEIEMNSRLRETSNGGGGRMNPPSEPDATVNEYILLPERGVRAGPTTPAFFYMAARSTLPPLGMTLGWPEGGSLREGSRFDFEPLLPANYSVATMNVIDSIHENGPKLVHVSDEAALALRAHSPVVRLVPVRKYSPMDVRYYSPTDAAASLPLQLPAEAMDNPAMTVQVESANGGSPVAGQRSSRSRWRSCDSETGATDVDGRVSLRLGTGTIQELDVDPPPTGYWGAFQQDIPISISHRVSLEPVDLSFARMKDALRHFYSSPPGGDGSGVRVAVVDTGIAAGHPHLGLMRARTQ